MTAPDLDESVLRRLTTQVGAANVARLVELFRANVRDRQTAARDAAEKQDQRALRVAFHSMKGSAQLVGARRLEEVAAHWEERARAGEVDSVDGALEEIAESFTRVERALEASSETC